MTHCLKTRTNFPFVRKFTHKLPCLLFCRFTRSHKVQSFWRWPIRENCKMCVFFYRPSATVCELCRLHPLNLIEAVKTIQLFTNFKFQKKKKTKEKSKQQQLGSSQESKETKTKKIVLIITYNYLFDCLCTVCMLMSLTIIVIQALGWERDTNKLLLLLLFYYAIYILKTLERNVESVAWSESSPNVKKIQY